MGDATLLSSREVIGRFYQRLEGIGQSSWPFMLGFYNTSDQSSEKYSFMNMAPVMREWIGGRQPKVLGANQIEIENLDFEATIRDLRKNFARDKTGQLDVRLSDMVRRSVTHWAKLLTTLIDLGDATAAYDSSNFFAADHSEGDSGTQKNLLVAGDYSQLNVTTPANPTAAEMSDVIMALVNHFYGFKDDVGEPINEDATDFTVMVPTNLGAAARTAATKALLNTGSGSVDNAIVGQADFTVSIKVNPRLTATDELYVFRTDAETKPFILQEEEGVTMSAKAENSEFEHDTNQWEFGIKAARNVGYGLWQHAIKATLS